MNEEEKKKLDNIKYRNEYSFCTKIDLDFVLNLIEKLQKENEELKDTNCLVKRYFKLKDTNTYLQKENERLKEKLLDVLERAKNN